ncbi:MAG: PA0069 family radical SAM protein [Pseudomonadota bacterium]
MEIDNSVITTSERRRGRGAQSNVGGRFEAIQRSDEDDGWSSLETLGALRTEVVLEDARSIITRNTSPDLSFDRSINPYRGCEHGCIYCYARPNHAYVGLSPGLDFETRLFAKTNAAALLRRELGRRGYTPATIALGAVTDPYQPIDRKFGITREILEVLAETQHPVGIVTKSAGVLRDLDILAPMAAQGLAKVAISVTSLERDVARKMEPRASSPAKRLEAVRALADAGVPVTVMTAPLIPALNDWEIEQLLEAARDAGASHASYVLLRLSHEIKTLFREWLVSEFPDRADRVINILREMRGGKDYDAAWGTRKVGRGPYAKQIMQRYRLALRRLGLNAERQRLRTDLFQPPIQKGGQMRLI